MSVRFDVSTEMLTRTTTLPTITSFTLMAWAYYVPLLSAVHAVLSFGSTNGASFYLIGLQNTNRVTVYNGSVVTDGTTAITNATWYHLAATVSGTGAGQFLAYLNGVQEISASGNASNTAAKLYVANSDGGDVWNGRITAVKVYSAVLTANEIKAEMRSFVPVRTANLNTWSPLLSSGDVGNYANTGTWTVAGTLTTEDGPPIAWAVRQPRTWSRTAAAVAAVTPQQNIFVRTVAVPSAVLV